MRFIPSLITCFMSTVILFMFGYEKFLLFIACVISGSITFFLAVLLCFILWNTGTTDLLTCQHLPAEQPICQHQSQRLLGLYSQTEAWQLQRVLVIQNDDGSSYHIALTTSRGEFMLKHDSNDREKVYQEFDRFRQLLKTEDHFLSHFHSNFNSSITFYLILTFFVSLIAFLILYSFRFFTFFLKLFFSL